eukprot:g964.t1
MTTTNDVSLHPSRVSHPNMPTANVNGRGKAVNGAQLREGGRKLMKAVKNNELKAIKTILDNPALYGGVDINYIDETSEYGDSPLIVAADIGHAGTVDLLLKYLIKPNPSKGIKGSLEVADCLGSTAIFCAKNAEIAKKLIDKGANLLAHNLQDSSPLHIHAWHGRHDVVETLCKYMEENDGYDVKAAVNALNKYMRTPLHRAAEIQEPYLYAKKEETCRVLISYGADLNAEDEEFNNPDNLARDTGYDELADKMVLWANKRKSKGDRESCVDNCVCM